MRDQSSLDALGLEKRLWIEEVYKKFNVLSLLNFVFRECLATSFAADKELATDGYDKKKKEARLQKKALLLKKKSAKHSSIQSSWMQLARKVN